VTQFVLAGFCGKTVNHMSRNAFCEDSELLFYFQAIGTLIQRRSLKK